ncbi:MAG: hypothetical protein AMXMBFR84_41370 [Candidatus Hydrogenedentota bacterium]
MAEAPDVFQVEFTCSNGSFTVECHRSWAPRGVDRFHELISAGFYNDARFFRVVAKPRPFVVQFGIPADPEVASAWRTRTFPDDPVKQTNAAGTVTFATAGPNTRTTQLFINLGDNAFLDGQGFSPIGKVVAGMEVVKSITDQYGERPDQGRIQSQGNSYLKASFPDMDYIKETAIVTG